MGGRRMKNDGGKAYPTSSGCNGGLTIRDYFAGQAMSRLAATFLEPDKLAAACYARADAMLVEREKVDE